MVTSVSTFTSVSSFTAALTSLLTVGTYDPESFMKKYPHIKGKPLDYDERDVYVPKNMGENQFLVSQPLPKYKPGLYKQK